MMLESIVLLLVVTVVFDFLHHRALTEQVKNQGSLLRLLKRRLQTLEDEDD